MTTTASQRPGGALDLTDIAALAQPTGEKILLLVLDGVGGLPLEPGGLTELETARTPNMDALLEAGGAGLHVPVATGVTPGSGPGHLSLFGFDPLRYRVGRGALAALGVEFPLQPGDVAIRGNLCTVDDRGVVVDRRAGRIPTEEAGPVLELLDGIRVPGGEVFVRPVKEHRFLLVLRPDETTEADIADTDPGVTGLPPLDVVPGSPGSEPAARVTREWLAQVPEALTDQPRANMVLLRGFATLPDWPRFPDVFRMRSLALAAYPMYRGVARLVGMDAETVEDDPAALVPALRDRIDDYDFFFLHVKGTDKAGEDGDFERKVDIIERVDEVLPALRGTGIGVTLITGDHSTPASMKNHSWHPVPFLLHGGPGRGHRSEGTAGFGESECARGSIGLIRGCELMPLAAARAGRLVKFGA
ncbi:MAG: 2,3-bisphosphoglycerate-independent phosphoglycerate mutase [Gemmatimonadetes bacterium]|nr:2,3-bisphosphoglycerate-independent phosphoglycerate mutase [Gemmatimonadota bacterium]